MYSGTMVEKGIRNGMRTAAWWSGFGSIAENARLVTVTPAIAEAWLTRNKKNRPINRRVLNEYKRQIEEGKWKINGETIIFDQNGWMINGQHRLNAILETGHSIDCYVIFDVDSGSFATLDSGSKRKTAQVFSLSGEQNCVALSAAIGVAWKFDRKLDPWLSIRPTATEAAYWLEENPSIRESVEICIQNTGSLGYGAVLAGFHFIASKLDRDAADGFIRSLGSGANLDEGNPILLLRNRLMSIKANKKGLGLHNHIILAMTIKSWNFIREGRLPVKTLRWLDTEPYPVIQ